MSDIGRHWSRGEQQCAADHFEDIGGNAIIYSYPNGDFDIVCAAERSFTSPGWGRRFKSEKNITRSDPDDYFAGQICEDQAGRKWLVEAQGPRPAAREKGKRSEGDDALRSMRRARAKLRRLALSNSFDYFVTLTLDAKEVDRYDAKAIMQRVNRWLDNMVRRCGLRYILVPEQHKDGAWHFHGFFAGDGLKAVDSGIRWDGREVYNLPQWSYGFSTAQRLYGEYSAAVAYVCKYIGKQQGQRPMGRWYYSGGGLAEPVKEYATLDYRELERDFDGEFVEVAIPGTQMLVIHHKTAKG